MEDNLAQEFKQQATQGSGETETKKIVYDEDLEESEFEAEIESPAKPEESDAEPKLKEEITDDDKKASELSDPGEPSSLSESLIARAQDLGVTPEELKGYENPDSVLNMIESKILNLGKQMQADANSGQQQFAKSPEQQQRSQVPSQPTQSPPPKLDLNLDDFEPEVKETFEKLNSYYDSKMSELNAQIEAMSGAMNAVFQEQQKKSQTEFFEKFEGMVNGLGEEFSGDFGKKGEKFSNESPAAKSRVKVLESMDALALGYQKLGKPIPGAEVLFDRAIKMEFGDKLKATAKREIEQSIVKNNDRLTMRPGVRKASSQVDPEKKAIERVKSFYKERGVSFDEGDSEGDDDLYV